MSCGVEELIRVRRQSKTVQLVPLHGATTLVLHCRQVGVARWCTRVRTSQSGRARVEGGVQPPWTMNL
eukprot:15483791-Alexandrium_andersonii.AAC.1